MDTFLEINVRSVYLTFSFASAPMYHAIHHHTAMVRLCSYLVNKCPNHYVLFSVVLFYIVLSVILKEFVKLIFLMIKHNKYQDRGVDIHVFVDIIYI